MTSQDLSNKHLVPISKNRLASKRSKDDGELNISIRYRLCEGAYFIMPAMRLYII